MALTFPAVPSARQLAKLAAVTVLTGILTGLAVLLLVSIVHGVEHLIWGHETGAFLDGLAFPENRWFSFYALTVAGLLAATVWYLLRRFGRKLVSIRDGVDGSKMPAFETLINTVIQVVLVGFGASIGKEVAPRELSAMLATKATDLFGVSPHWRKVLVASAAGAGLAAVYNVPLGGTLFAIEVLLGQFTISGAIIAISVSSIATLVARPLVPDATLYVITPGSVNASLLVAALIVGPIMGLCSHSFLAVVKRLGQFNTAGARTFIFLPVSFALVGLIGVFFPIILGNGRALATLGFSGVAPLGTLLILAALKYVATSLSLGAGAVGGTLQPSIAIGSALGSAAAILWALIWPGADATSLAVVAAAAFLAVNLRAPFTAIAIMVEFTGIGTTLMLPTLIAVGGALFADQLLFNRAKKKQQQP